MKKKIQWFSVLTLVFGTLVGCGSKTSDTGDSGGGGYISCVLELTEARRAGIISATDQEIQQECSSQQLP